MQGVVRVEIPDAVSGYEYAWVKAVPRSPLGQKITLDYEILFPSGMVFPGGWFVCLNGKGVGTPGWDGPSPFNLDCTNGQWRLIVKGAGTPIAPLPGGTVPQISNPSEIQVPLGAATPGKIDKFHIEIVLAEQRGSFIVSRNGATYPPRMDVPTTYTGSKDREWWTGGYMDATKSAGARYESWLGIDGQDANLDPAYWGTGKVTLVSPDWPLPLPPTDKYAKVRAEMTYFKAGSPHIYGAFDELLKVLG